MSLYEARLHVKLLQVDYTSLLSPDLSFSDKVWSFVSLSTHENDLHLGAAGLTDYQLDGG